MKAQGHQTTLLYHNTIHKPSHSQNLSRFSTMLFACQYPPILQQNPTMPDLLHQSIICVHASSRTKCFASLSCISLGVFTNHQSQRGKYLRSAQSNQLTKTSYILLTSFGQTFTLSSQPIAEIIRPAQEGAGSGTVLGATTSLV